MHFDSLAKLYRKCIEEMYLSVANFQISSRIKARRSCPIYSKHYEDKIKDRKNSVSINFIASHSPRPLLF